MTDNRNTILAVILSGLVLIAWQYFYNIPQMEKQRAAQRGADRNDQAGAAGTGRPPPPRDRPGAGAVGQRAGVSQPVSPRQSSAVKPRSPPHRASRSTLPGLPAASR